MASISKAATARAVVATARARSVPLSTPLGDILDIGLPAVTLESAALPHLRPDRSRRLCRRAARLGSGLRFVDAGRRFRCAAGDVLSLCQSELCHLGSGAGDPGRRALRPRAAPHGVGSGRDRRRVQLGRRRGPSGVAGLSAAWGSPDMRGGRRGRPGGRPDLARWSGDFARRLPAGARQHVVLAPCRIADERGRGGAFGPSIGRGRRRGPSAAAGALDLRRHQW